MSRRAVVLAALVLAALVVACATPAWVVATTSSPSVARVPLAVAGSTLAPGVGAGALVVAAAALALAMGRRWGQRVALVGIAAGGALVTASAVAALGSARVAALSAAQEAVGVGTLVDEPRVVGWPWFAAALGLVIVALAVVAGVRSRGWATPSQRFEVTAAHAEPSGRPATEQGSSTAAAGPPDQDSVEVWEALTRGEDPT